MRFSGYPPGRFFGLNYIYTNNDPVNEGYAEQPRNYEGARMHDKFIVGYNAPENEYAGKYQGQVRGRFPCCIKDS